MQTVRTMIGARRGIAAPAIRAALVAAGALLTCGCNTTQQVAGVRGGLHVRDRGRGAHQPTRLHRPVDQGPQVGQFERLEQVLVSPLLHRLNGQVGGPVAGDQDDRDAGVDPPEAEERFQPGGVRQADVEDDDIRTVTGEAQRLAAVAGFPHVESLEAQGSAEDVARGAVVVDEQHSVLHGM